MYPSDFFKFFSFWVPTKNLNDHPTDMVAGKYLVFAVSKDALKLFDSESSYKRTLFIWNFFNRLNLI